MSAYENTSLPGAGQSDEKLGTKVWAFVQRVVGPLLVALVLWGIADRNSIRGDLNTVLHDLEVHQIEGRGRHAALDKDLVVIFDDIQELADAQANCELSVQRMLIEIAKLPPDEWEQRIIANERGILRIEARMDNAK